MTRAIVHPLWGSLSLDRQGELSLQSQVVAYFRQAIIEGRLRRGLRLPSSRQLARDHGISRTTAVEAYEQLIAEGYLFAQAGSGIFVSERIPEDFIPEGGAQIARPPRERAVPPGDIDLMDPRHYQMALAPGMPAVDLFPWTDWNRHIAAVLRDHPICEIFHGDRFGERPLRDAIVDYLGAMKGIRCDANQIVVIGGTVQIFDYALELLRAPGSKAMLEDPAYPFVRMRMPKYGFEVVGAPIDEQGMDFEKALAAAPDAHVAFVSPSHAVPTGACLSLERRRRLVEWADSNDRWIIENEFDGDFRFTSRPLPTCYSLSRNNRVLMIGSLSKPFAPGLRLGYLLLPPELLERARSLAVPQAPISTQLAMARLSDTGALATHLRQLRNVHEQRRAILLGALERHMKGLAKLEHAPDAGLRVVLSLPEATDDVAIAIAAHEIGVKIDALSPCFVDRKIQPGLVLGFGSTPEHEIEPAVERLTALLRKHLGRCADVAAGA